MFLSRSQWCRAGNIEKKCILGEVGHEPNFDTSEERITKIRKPASWKEKESTQLWEGGSEHGYDNNEYG